MASALIKLVSIDLVHVALTNLNITSPPGFHGIPCSVYATFASAFVPVMHDIVSTFYAIETFSDNWSLALLNVIPTTRGIVNV